MCGNLCKVPDNQLGGGQEFIGAVHKIGLFDKLFNPKKGYNVDQYKVSI